MLTLFFLQLDGDTTYGGPLQPLHQMSTETGNLVPQWLGRDHGYLLNDPFVGVEIECQLSVVLFNDDPAAFFTVFVRTRPAQLSSELEPPLIVRLRCPALLVLLPPKFL